MEDKCLTVSAINRYIKYKFEYDKNLENILVSAEISNFKCHSSGTFYLKLKDENSEIKAVMFSRLASNVNFLPKDGDKVIVKGSVRTFEKSGEYQLYIETMSLSGIGELYLKFEKLKKELEAKGLFDRSHKKQLPKFPKTIGVLTSDTGAAIHDIITTILRRYPLCTIILYPTLVQGEYAKNSIVSNIEKANKDNLCDILIVGRGGGSLEDLWPFNEEIVAYAIYNSNIPIVSAVGHEVDFSISDFVSDVRAATPTAAAELVTPNIVDLKNNIKLLYNRLNNNINKIFEDKTIYITNLEERLSKTSPLNKLNQHKKDLDKLIKTIDKNFNDILCFKKDKIDNFSKNLDVYIKYIIDYKSLNYFNLNNKLEALSPLKIMDKGFSIASINGHIIKNTTDAKVDDMISIKLKDGTIDTKVVEVHKDGK